jgi:tetratricopeptide (TPR) repeat protein
MTERRKTPETGYDEAINNATSAAGAQAELLFREIDEAAALLGELLSRPQDERQGLVRTEVRFQALKVCQLLEARCAELWGSDPAAAVELARLAVEIAGRLDASHYGAALVEDAQAQAWACLGNSLRVASDLRQAEEALQTAEEHLERSGGEAYTEAHILSLKASLRNSQGRFRDAVSLLDQALAIYREAKDRHLEGKTLIKKGMTVSYDSRFRLAVRLVRRGLSLIDPAEDPRLLVSARHNLIWSLNESGGHEQALDTLRKTLQLYRDLGEPSHRARLRWLEGRITRDLGRLDEAEEALQEALSFFLERQIGFDAAMVMLDLATIYEQRGEPAELKRLAAEMVPIFTSRDIHPEARRPGPVGDQFSTRLISNLKVP